LNDIRAELEEAARLMPAPQKINMMLVDYSSPLLTAYLKGEESDTLPQTPARDFFLHSLCPDRFFVGIESDVRALFTRELSTVVHRMNINRVQFSLEPQDWHSMTKLMLSFVVTALEVREMR
jgi:hypothetical protein